MSIKPKMNRIEIAYWGEEYALDVRIYHNGCIEYRLHICTPVIYMSVYIGDVLILEKTYYV